MSTTTRRFQAIGLIALLIVAGAPATAHRATPTDANDTPGLFDIRRASFSHRDGRIRVSATTDEAWKAQLLAAEAPGNGPNDNAFQFQFESRGNKWADYLVVVDYKNGKIVANLLKWVPPGEKTNDAKFVAHVNGTKRGRTVFAKFAKRRLRPRDSYIAWDAESYFVDDGACENQCSDYAPNQGLFVHTLK